jgi:hypothetical protein
MFYMNLLTTERSTSAYPTDIFTLNPLFFLLFDLGLYLKTCDLCPKTTQKNVNIKT